MTIPLDQTAALTRTYSGVLDDVMLRYGKGREFLSAPFFNKMILKNVIFGSGIFLNDGYLINHPLARTHLADPESLLSHMISVGFVRILSRDGDPDSLARMPERMAREGNASFQQIVASNAWEGAEGEAFRRVAASVFHTGAVRPWPAFDMTAGFLRLMDRVFASPVADVGLSRTSQSDLARIEEAFHALDPAKGNARDKIEKAARQVAEAEGAGTEDIDLRMEELMEIANQAYHYNFGMTLGAEENAVVAADTTVGMAFDELLRTHRVERAQLDQVPLLRFRRDPPMENGVLFLPFIRADHPLSSAKRDYMAKLSALLVEEARDISDLARDAHEATEAYIKRIEGYFDGALGRGAVEIDMSGLADFGLSLDGGPVATASPTAHLSIALQRAARNSRRFLLDRFEVVDVTQAYDAPNDDPNTVSFDDIRTQLSSIAFDEGAAKEFVDGLPTFDPPA